MTVLVVALGGALGSVARHLVGVGLASALGEGFPYGTLAVNLVGSCLLGVLGTLAAAEVIGPTTLAALGTGFMGGFTTYSTFSLDLFKQLQTGQYALAAAYLGATLLGGLGGTALGAYGAGKLGSGPNP